MSVLIAVTSLLLLKRDLYKLILLCIACEAKDLLFNRLVKPSFIAMNIHCCLV